MSFVVCFYFLFFLTFLKKNTYFGTVSALSELNRLVSGRIKNQENKKKICNGCACNCVNNSTACPSMLDASALPLEVHLCFPKSQRGSFFIF